MVRFGTLDRDRRLDRWVTESTRTTRRHARLTTTRFRMRPAGLLWVRTWSWDQAVPCVKAALSRNSILAVPDLAFAEETLCAGDRVRVRGYVYQEIDPDGVVIKRSIPTVSIVPIEASPRVSMCRGGVLRMCASIVWMPE